MTLLQLWIISVFINICISFFLFLFRTDDKLGYIIDKLDNIIGALFLSIVLGPLSFIVIVPILIGILSFVSYMWVTGNITKWLLNRRVKQYG